MVQIYDLFEYEKTHILIFSESIILIIQDYIKISTFSNLALKNSAIWTIRIFKRVIIQIEGNKKVRYKTELF